MLKNLVSVLPPAVLSSMYIVYIDSYNNGESSIPAALVTVFSSAFLSTTLPILFENKKTKLKA